LGIGSRLIFDFCFHYSKLRHDKDTLNDVPVMVVCEEAHNYIPQKDNAAYRSSIRPPELIDPFLFCRSKITHNYNKGAFGQPLSLWDDLDSSPQAPDISDHNEIIAPVLQLDR
jgi:hypothetical protein